MWEGGRGPNLKLTHMLQQMTLVYKNRRQEEFGRHDRSKGMGGRHWLDRLSMIKYFSFNRANSMWHKLPLTPSAPPTPPHKYICTQDAPSPSSLAPGISTLRKLNPAGSPQPTCGRGRCPTQIITCPIEYSWVMNIWDTGAYRRLMCAPPVMHLGHKLIKHQLL